jgi:uncharacterized alkaline shock family protein YloU
MPRYYSTRSVGVVIISLFLRIGCTGSVTVNGEDDCKDPGKITISDDVLADLAGLTCTRCYGIVGMASQSFQEGVAELLGRDSLRKGVRLKRVDGLVNFDLYVIVEAGVNIAEVAHNLIEQVKYMVESSTGLEVGEVQVHVQGVRVN